MKVSSVGTTAGYTSDRAMTNGPEKKSVEPAEASASVQQTKQNISEERQKQLDKSIEKVLQMIERPETTVQRSVHEGTNQIVYKVMNKTSGEVIKQIPEEKLLDIAAKIMELSGILFDERV